MGRRTGRQLMLFLVLTLVGGEAVAACRSDGDCTDGTVCLFSRGRLDGACGRKEMPIDLPKESVDYAKPLRERPDTGAPCQFTPDCLPGLRCYKRGGEVQGRCLKPQ